MEMKFAGRKFRKFGSILLVVLFFFFEILEKAPIQPIRNPGDKIAASLHSRFCELGLNKSCTRSKRGKK